METIELLSKIKIEYNIDNILSLREFNLKKERINLFYSKEKLIEYSLYTDGSIELINTWLDKRPYQRDSFLNDCDTVKRLEFSIDEANFFLLDKKYNSKRIRNLYIEYENIDKIIEDKIYQVMINSYQNIKIKRLEKSYGNKKSGSR